MVLPYFLAANCFGAYCIKEHQRLRLLDEAKAAGITVIRIFLTEIDYEGWKGCDADYVPDLEQHGLGQYDDRILELVDRLMLDCHRRGLKLTIAIADTYKCQNVWGSDKYFERFGGNGQGGRGFYLSDEAQRIFDDRIRHVLAHRNPHLGNRPYAELHEVIWSIQPHNEPMGHMNRCRPSWTAEKARLIKSLLPAGSPILVSTGGGTDVKLSLDNEHEWTSPDIDVISLHSYEDRHDIVSAVEKGLKLAQKHNKHLIVEEVGFKGPNKASEIKSLVKSLKSLGVPFFYWQIVSGPGKGEEDYEISPEEVDSWKALLAGSPDGNDRGSKLGKFGRIFGR